MLKEKELPVVVAAPFLPGTLITIQEVARRLRPDDPPEKGVPWVREKVRRRSPNPMPCYNLGKHLMFDWIKISDWVRESARPVHAPHNRRRVDRRQGPERRQLDRRQNQLTDNDTPR